MLMPANLEVLLCYAHEDELLCKELVVYLAGLDAISIVDTVGEFIGGAALGSLLGCESSKVRNSCLLHFFSC
jgi:hypothetical protein